MHVVRLNVLPLASHVGVLLAVVVTPAFAKSPCDPPAELDSAGAVVIALGDRLDADCFRGGADAPASPVIAVVVRPWQDSDIDHVTRWQQARDALTAVANELTAAEAEAGEPSVSALRAIRFALAEDRTALAARPDYRAAERWALNQVVQFLPIREEAEWGVDLRDDLRFVERCEPPSGHVSECRAAYDDAAVILRFANLIYQAFAYHGVPFREATLRDATLAIGRWDNYFESARSQFIWELFLNDLRYDAVPEGFPDPPSSQIILMHPNASLEYAPDAEDRVKGILTLEVLGYNFWRWHRDSSDMSTALGVSAVVNFADREGYDTVSYGAMAHYANRYSVGVAFGKGPNGVSTSMFVSVDLARVITSQSKKLRALRDSLSLP